MRKSRFLTVATLGLGAALLLWLGRSNENASTPSGSHGVALPAPANDPHLVRTDISRPQLPGTELAGAAQREDPDAWAGGRPIQRMQLPAVSASAQTTPRPEAQPKVTPAEESAFLAAKHQALHQWQDEAQRVVAACFGPDAPHKQGEQDAHEPVSVHVDVSFTPRPAPEGQREHVFVAEWVQAPPPMLDALASGRNRHLLEGCLARLQAIELRIDTNGAAGPVGPDVRLAESVAIQM